MMKRHLAMVALVIQCLLPCEPSAEESGRRDRASGWFIAGYLGQLTDSTMPDIASLQVEFVPSYMGALAIGKEIYRYKEALSVEVEGQVAAYLNRYVFECDTEDCLAFCPEAPPSATQNHTEWNLFFTLRWLPFPWDRHLDTSVAVGEGLSYATRVPAVERDLHGEVVGLDSPTSKLLNYLMLEVAFGLPSHPRWDLNVRLHHRSGAFGLFNDVHGGSNTVCVGLRYKL